jgi:hypothetical protein
MSHNILGLGGTFQRDAEAPPATNVSIREAAPGDPDPPETSGMYRNTSFFIALLVLTSCFAATRLAGAQPTGYEGYQVVRVMVTDKAELEKFRGLRALGEDFQMWAEVMRPGLLEVRVAPAARLALDASGLRYEVTIADLQRHLDELFAGLRAGDFFNSLRTYQEHVQFMTDLAAQHPALAQMIEVGQSVQGRPMWALRITGPGQVKPAVMYHGAEHGNEAAGASVVAYAAHHLLTNYESDPDVEALVDNVEWYLLPIMNPDGYVSYSRHNAHGVDLNRNWDGPGSGQDPWGGPYPFSEPETAAMRDFFLARPTVRVHIDFHGYVPWIMWPWGHTPDHCPDHALYFELGSQIRNLVAAAGGGSYIIGTIYNVAYPVSGCSTNWVYGDAQRHSFSIETVDAQMPEICQEFLSSMMFLGQWIADTDCNGNGVDDDQDISNGTSEDANGNGVPDECEAVLGDLDGDGTVGIADLLMLLGAWGPCPNCDPPAACPADLNGDCTVGVVDLLILLANWS